MNHPVKLLPLKQVIPTLNKSGAIRKQVTRDHFSQFPMAQMTLRSLETEDRMVKSECILYSPCVTPTENDELAGGRTHADSDAVSVYNNPANCRFEGIVAADVVSEIALFHTNDAKMGHVA